MKVAPISGTFLAELALGLAVAGAVWYLLHQVSAAAGNAASAVATAAGDAVDVADNGIAAVVTGIGGVVGIPDTSMDQCTQALREGRIWDASFACPAKTFASYLAGNSPQQDYNWQAHGAR